MNDFYFCSIYYKSFNNNKAFKAILQAIRFILKSTRPNWPIEISLV